MKTNIPVAIITASILSAFLGQTGYACACTRAVYFGMDGQTITGRSMDWVFNSQSDPVSAARLSA